MHLSATCAELRSLSWKFSSSVVLWAQAMCMEALDDEGWSVELKS